MQIVCLNFSYKYTTVGCYCFYDPNVEMHLHNTPLLTNNIRQFVVIIYIQNVKQLRVHKKQICTRKYVTGAKTVENSWDAQNSHL